MQEEKDMILEEAGDVGATRWSRMKKNAASYWYYFTRSRSAVLGLIIVSLIILAALFAKWIAPYPEHAGIFTDFQNKNVPPSSMYLFGTDKIGRDILSRILLCLGDALISSALVLVIAIPIGLTVGLVAGYYSRKWPDTVLMRITDTFLSIPAMVLAMAVAAILTKSMMHTMLAISVVWWPSYARIVYAQICSMKNETFITVAELIGASRRHIIFKEMLPNCVAPVLTKAALDFGTIILCSASLSYLGLGVQAPAPSLGQMVSDGQAAVMDYPWQLLFPALCIVIIVLGFNLLGDGIRNMLAKGAART